VIVNATQLLPGFQVLEPVTDARGQVLLPAGATLTENSIHQLVQRGITQVSVNQVETPEEREARLAQENERILKIFGDGELPEPLAQLRRVLLEVLDAR
jgi:hypothetical protein